MDVKKNYRKIGNKKEIYIYIDVKTNINEYVKLIIYLYIYIVYIYIYIYIYIVKKIGINNNYVVNDVMMRWRNKSSTAINAMFQLLVIYRYRWAPQIHKTLIL